MLKRIQAGGYAEVVLFVKNDAPGPPPRSLWQKIRDNGPRLVYALHDLVERKAFPVSPDAFAPRPLKDFLPAVPMIRVKPIQTKFSDSLTDEDIRQIDSHKVDVLIRMGFRILRGKVLTVARYGVWSYHHGDNYVNRGGPPGFWEVVLGWPETGSILQILTEELDGGQVLYRSWSQTESLSVRRNKNNFYWKSLSFLPRKLEQLHRVGDEAFFARAKAENSEPCFYSNRLFVAPGNWELARHLARHYGRYLGKKIRGLFYFDQWYLMFALNKAGGMSTSAWKFKEILPPKDRFWADPFIWQRDGRYYVFIEDLPYATMKGHISYFTIDEKGKYTEPKKVIDRPYHLSYPFLFEYQGELYMMPESAQNRTLEVYRCVEFPEKWELAKVLMKDIYAVDATLHQDAENGRWWMFVNIREHNGASSFDELFIFHADNPLSTEWTPHTANPVVSDARSARPAGRIFSHEGKLYRPSQDCSRGYGYAILINRIDKLTPDEYRETRVTGVEPNWDPRVSAVHTLNCEGKLTVLDGFKRRRKF